MTNKVENHVRRVKKLVALGRIDEALDILNSLLISLDDEFLLNQLLVLKSRYSNFIAQKITGTGGSTTELNSISYSILELLKSVENPKENGKKNTTIENISNNKGCLFSLAKGSTQISFQILLGFFFLISIGTFFWIDNKNKKLIGINGNNNDNNVIIIGDSSKINIGNEVKRKCDIPLTTQKVNDFRNLVIGKIGLIGARPLSVSRREINSLEPLIRRVEENICYEEQMPLETSMLFRLYGSVVILGTNDDFSIHPADPFKEGFPYIQKSKELNQEVWQSEIDLNAYTELKEAYKNLGKYDFAAKENLKKYTCNVLVTLMLGAEKDRIDEQCNKLAEMIDKAVTENKDIGDLVYFMKASIGDTDYRLMMEAVKMMIVGSGGKFKGPEAVPQSNGYTLIKYTTSGMPKNPTFEWMVNSKEKIIKANNNAAEVVEQGIRNKKKK